MKKIAIVLFCAFAMTQLSAQDQLGSSLGLNVGTKGLGADLGLAITPRIGIRGSFNYGNAQFQDKNIKIRRFNDEKVPVSGDLKLSTFDVIGELAILPFFRVAGGINGVLSTQLADLTFKSSTPLNVYDVQFTPDANNQVHVTLENKRKIRPYASLNFGRLVPTRRIGFGLELGAIFRAAPTVTALDSAAPSAQTIPLLQKEIDSKGHIYPVVNVRIAFKL